MRLFKTRTQASQACELNRVFIAGQPVKASRLIKPGDWIEIRRTGLTRTFEVIQLTEKRLSAKLVVDYYKDHTPKEAIIEYRARIARAAAFREPGAGRPTKKERRDLDEFLDAIDDLLDT